MAYTIGTTRRNSWKAPLSNKDPDRIHNRVTLGSFLKSLETTTQDMLGMRLTPDHMFTVIHYIPCYILPQSPSSSFWNCKLKESVSVIITTSWHTFSGLFVVSLHPCLSIIHFAIHHWHLDWSSSILHHLSSPTVFLLPSFFTSSTIFPLCQTHHLLKRQFQRNK